MFLKCPECEGLVNLQFGYSKKYGLSIELNICCKGCEWEAVSLSSIGVASAVLNFNDWQQFLNKLFNELEMTFGINTQNYCIHKDTKPISKAEKQYNPEAKSRRKKLIAIKKVFATKMKDLKV